MILLLGIVFIGCCWVLMYIPRLFRWLFTIDLLNAPPRNRILDQNDDDNAWPGGMGSGK
jgi:hypothetical protein